ncbi:MAG: exodeoxyribonuclease VII large subunit [Elusimicrobiota bacterium]
METLKRVFTVSELNAQVHELLDHSFAELWIEGEVSNCKTYPSGHTYLSLKDDKSQIRAVLFKGASFSLKFKLQDGLKILAFGRVTSYEPRGELQLVLSTAQPREKGSLALALEQLKAKLQAEGLFDASRKKSPPPYPKIVGVVTSGSGAAVRDIIEVLSRRWPGLEIRVWPVKVQGPGAAAEIAEAVRGFNELAPDTDVLLVGRGGGSIEDLWAFNEEPVARAIAASAIPVISCVGHETDTTIADFVADVRAPTPSAAAELAVSLKSDAQERLADLHGAMAQVLREKLENLERRLSYARAHPLLQDPRRLWEQRVQRVDELSLRLPEALKRRLETLSLRLAAAAGRLDAISPLAVLARGYAIATTRGKVLTRASQVAAGDPVTLRLSQGSIHCEVTT